MLDHFLKIETLIPISVFFGGMIGSLHCLSMCGPIVLSLSRKKSWLINYQLGRMTSYSLAGALAGGFGSQLFGTHSPPWLSALSLLAIAVVLLLNSYKIFRGRGLHFKLHSFISLFSNRIWSFLKISPLSKNKTSAIAGFATVFLPCGHLYSFIVGAIATGSAINGTLFMLAFWLGSTPLLSATSRIFFGLFNQQTASHQKWAASFLLVAGFLSVISFGARARELYEGQSKAPDEKMGQMLCH